MSFRFADRMGGVTLSGIREVFEAAGEDSINLGLGEPDVEPPDAVKRGAREALDRGEASYTENRGIEELRELVAERHNDRYGTSYGEENVLVTSGASEALHLAFQALVNPGDPVAFTDPWFVSYRNLAAIAGGAPRPLDTRAGDGFRPDPEALNELLTGEEALLVLNSPSNPTGAVTPRETLDAVLEVARDRGVPVLSDEVYDEFVYTGEHATAGEDAVVVNSFSKSFAMTGFRLGYLLAPEEVVEECLKVHQYVQACAPSVSQWAGVAALREAPDFPRRVRETFRARRDLLLDGFEELGVECVEPGGAFYAFPDVSRFGGGEAVSRALARNGVLTVPGSAFGSKTGFLRVSYAASLDDIEAALGVMEEVLPELEAQA